MSNLGRPGKYETHVKPRFDEIQKWVENGETEKDIAKKLEVHDKVLLKYKRQHPELAKLFIDSRRKPVSEIKTAMLKAACGYYYTETKITESDKDGKKVEKFTKYARPDATSALILLKHWDKETEWTSDPATLRLKKKELQLKIDESNKWK